MTAPVAQYYRLADFDYALPDDLIAQEPAPERDSARLMIVNRGTGGVAHRVFSDIEEYLNAGDVLVLNDTRVFPCRLSAVKPGGGRAEIFLLEERERNVWDALVKGCSRTGKRLKIAGGIEAEVLASQENGARVIRFHGVEDIRAILREIGSVPLPPYIRRTATEHDRMRYQTVYAATEGAVAAPTAGLHFSEELLRRLEGRSIEFVKITLHVGPGTFQPVRADRISDHRMPPERYAITPEAAAAINRAKSEGRRVIAVGTTSVRTIETAASEGTVVSGSGVSRLFIYPGYAFRIIDGLITNFHLPKSTLLMLVSAFAGREQTLAAYQLAVQERYRFYSYGDAMFIA